MIACMLLHYSSDLWTGANKERTDFTHLHPASLTYTLNQRILVDHNDMKFVRFPDSNRIILILIPEGNNNKTQEITYTAD